MHEGKEKKRRKKERKKERRRKTKLKKKFSHQIFLTVRRSNGTMELYFTLEKLRVFIYKSFMSFHCVYHGAASIP